MTNAPVHMNADSRMTTVGGVTADLFRAYGAEHLFLLTGGDNAFLFELRDRGVDLVLARSERASAFMADAYARLTGKPTFVYGQFGPGAMVVLSGLIDALYGKSPVVAVASEASRAVVQRYAYQELDQVALFRPVVKWGARVEVAGRLPDLFRTAVREAVTGVPGPTYLGIPTDLLLEETATPAAYAESMFMHAPAVRPRPAAAAVEALARALSSAERPVLLAGTGVISSGAWDEVTALAEAYSLPVVTSVGGKGAIRETHPLAHGVTGRYSRASANDIVRRADFVLAVGSRLNDMTTNRGQTVTAGHRIAHIDVDTASLGRTVEEELSVVGDAKAALADLAEALAPHAGWAGWAAEAAAVTEAWKERRAEAERATPADGGLSPVAIVGALRDALGPTDVVVADTGHSAAWTSTFFDVQQAGMQHVRTAGSLGWGLPAALGAQLARPDDRVVCVIGDGGIGYHLADIETAVRRGLPVVVVLLNNGTLAFEYQVQRKRLGRVDPTFLDFADTDYAAIARAFGAAGRRVSAQDELAPALAEALADGGPVLLDVETDRGANAPVTNFEDLEPRSL